MKALTILNWVLYTWHELFVHSGDRMCVVDMILPFVNPHRKAGDAGDLN